MAPGIQHQGNSKSDYANDQRSKTSEENLISSRYIQGKDSYAAQGKMKNSIDTQSLLSNSMTLAEVQSHGKNFQEVHKISSHLDFNNYRHQNSPTARSNDDYSPSLTLRSTKIDMMEASRAQDFEDRFHFDQQRGASKNDYLTEGQKKDIIALNTGYLTDRSNSRTTYEQDSLRHIKKSTEKAHKPRTQDLDERRSDKRRSRRKSKSPQKHLHQNQEKTTKLYNASALVP